MKTGKILTVLVLLLGVGLAGMSAGSAHAALPAPWNNQDVGDPCRPGSASYDPCDQSFSVNGAGEDIWDTWDQFHCVYRSRSGDFTITARVVSITGKQVHAWAKAGVMVRDTLSGKSKHAMMVITPDSGASFQYRFNTGEVTWHSTQGGRPRLTGFR